MSEKKFHKSSEGEEESSKSKDNLKDILKESLLLNMDIFSSEFEDKDEEIESQAQVETDIETNVEVEKIEPENILVKAEEFEREYEEDEFIRDLANGGLEIDFDEGNFMLNIEEGNIDQNGNFDFFPKIKIEIDRPETKHKTVKKIKTSKTKIKENFNMDAESKNKKLEKAVKDKEEFFKVSEIDPKKVKAKEKYREIEKKEKIDKSPARIEESFDINKSFGEIDINKNIKLEDKKDFFEIDKIASKEVKVKSIARSKFSVQNFIEDEDIFNIDLNQNEDRALLSKDKKKSIYNSFNEEKEFSSRQKNNLKIEGL